MHLWTLKEAAHKATGAGLTDRLDQPEFDPAQFTGCGETPSPRRSSGWAFRRFLLPDRFVLSLAMPEDRRSVQVDTGSADFADAGGDVNGGGRAPEPVSWPSR